MNATKDRWRGGRAVTIHVYSPPYRECKVGSTWLPVVFCEETAPCMSVVTSCTSRTRAPLFVNFQQLTEMLRAKIPAPGPKHSPQTVEDVKRLLEQVGYRGAERSAARVVPALGRSLPQRRRRLLR